MDGGDNVLCVWAGGTGSCRQGYDAREPWAHTLYLLTFVWSRALPEAVWPRMDRGGAIGQFDMILMTLEIAPTLYRQHNAASKRVNMLGPEKLLQLM